MERAPSRERFEHWLVERSDDDVLRLLFGTMLVATLVVFAMDYVRLNELETSIEQPGTLPDMGNPSAVPLPSHDGDRSRPSRPRPDAKLKDKMSFELVGDGRLMATGRITPGIAKTFADEIAKRGAYIKTIVLNSPGGSVNDALTMGRLIREKKFHTAVEAGHYCASSCPLVFAGGVQRRAGNRASIGVHQVFAISKDDAPVRDGMGDGQRISAQCQKYLLDMGIDLEVWVHAMETPKEQLYYFKPQELLALKLATQIGLGERSPPKKS